MGYYVGDYKRDAPSHRGWIMGKFIEDGPRKTDLAEVKYWEYAIGPNDHPPKISETLECTLILSGSCKGFVAGEEYTFRAGNYVVIEPGIPNNLVAEILEPIVGITIKAPSDPSAKKTLEMA